MTTLTITRGLPGSGKTTVAEKLVAENQSGRARVNRDDLRRMMHGGRLGTNTQEEQVTVAQMAQIEALLVAGVDVICDDTNLSEWSVDALRRLAEQAGAEFEVIDLRGVDVEVCIARDALRKGSARVGEQVIREMAARQGRVRVRPT